MAATWVGEIDIKLRATPTVTVDLGGGAVPILMEFFKRLSLNVAKGLSDSVTSGAPDTIDLRGGLNDLEGTAINRSLTCLIAVRNKSSTAGQYLTVGAGSNPITTIWGASGDAAIVGPDSVGIFMSTIDGFGLTAGTADILQIAAATGTISYDVVIWWL